MPADIPGPHRGGTLYPAASRPPSQPPAAARQVTCLWHSDGAGVLCSGGFDSAVRVWRFQDHDTSECTVHLRAAPVVCLTGWRSELLEREGTSEPYRRHLIFTGSTDGTVVGVSWKMDEPEVTLTLTPNSNKRITDEPGGVVPGPQQCCECYATRWGEASSRLNRWLSSLMVPRPGRTGALHHQTPTCFR